MLSMSSSRTRTRISIGDIAVTPKIVHKLKNLMLDASQQFGFSWVQSEVSLSPTVVFYLLKPILKQKQAEMLSTVLNAMGDNIKCVAHKILKYATFDIIYHEKILQDLLRRDLPQDVFQSLFADLLQDSDWKPMQVRLYCKNRQELPRLYLQSIASFPIPFLVKQFTSRCNTVYLNEISQYEECKRRISLLLKYGADINARETDEPTPIHLAATRGAWEVVEVLLAHQANIDIEIGGITARKIIASEKLDLVQNYEEKCESKSITDTMYDALYENNEERFLNLLVENTNIDVNDHNGKETFLQLAIINKFEKSAAKLIKRGADTNLVAGLGIEPILLAFRNPELECLELLFHTRSMKWHISHNSGTILHELNEISPENVEKHRKLVTKVIQEALNQKVNIYAHDNDDLTALQKIASQGPKGYPLLCLLLPYFVQKFDSSVLQIIPPQVFERFFDERVEFQNDYEAVNDYLSIDYRFMIPNNRESKETVPEMSLLYEMSKVPEYSKTALLHPFVQLFLVYKWRKIAFVSVVNFFVYTVFTLSLSIHAYKSLVPENVTEIYQRNLTQTDFHNSGQFSCWHIIAITSWCVLFAREVFQFAILSYRLYFKSWENLLEILLLILSLLTYLPTFEDIKLIRAASILLAYLEFTLLIGRYPSRIAIYITMFTRVAMKSSKVFLMFSAFLFSFALSFFIIYKDIPSDEKGYDTMWVAVIRTSMMAIGEFNFNDFQKFSTFGGEIIMLMFVFSVTIVFMNLLNALAFIDTQKIINETQSLCCIATINYCTRIEAKFFRYDPEKLNIQDYFNKKDMNRNRMYKLFSSLLSVNVFPLKLPSSLSTESLFAIPILVKRSGFLPIVYKAPVSRHCWQKLYFWLRSFYYRTMLHCDEDKILKTILAKKKYPDLNTDEPIYAEKLQKLIMRHEETLQSLKSQNEKYQKNVINLINECFVSKTGGEKCTLNNLQEKEIRNLTVAMQNQISELKTKMEDLKMDEISQIDLHHVTAEIVSINNQLKQLLACIGGQNETP